ncbi:curli assembly protein CsgF [Leisingera sp. ANG-M1]|uniref:curli assembly protein CsgF n=1 Tax=Leisingera sp. ANG-M1 TaxID=1577895 RepID=UPI00068AA59F|nr:curli assembly protein CsgF [Leisingera sp. ANG-M1]
MSSKRLCPAAALACAALGAPACASDQTFSFNLPSFGGSGLSSSYYLNLLETQKRPKEDERQRPSSLEQFSQDLERRLLSTLSSNIVEEIFGEDRSESGSFSAGGLDVVYETVGGDVVVTITDGVTTTEIIVPAL